MLGSFAVAFLAWTGVAGASDAPDAPVTGPSLGSTEAPDILDAPEPADDRDPSSDVVAEAAVQASETIARVSSTASDVVSSLAPPEHLLEDPHPAIVPAAAPLAPPATMVGTLGTPQGEAPLLSVSTPVAIDPSGRAAVAPPPNSPVLLDHAAVASIQAMTAAPSPESEERRSPRSPWPSAAVRADRAGTAPSTRGTATDAWLHAAPRAGGTCALATTSPVGVSALSSPSLCHPSRGPPHKDAS